MKPKLLAWLVPFALLALWTFGLPSANKRTTGREWERDSIRGIWMEQGGEPGNYVRLEMVETPSPVSGALVKVFEGQATFCKQFGHAAPTHAIWNYENSQPLRLNIIFKDHSGFLAVRMVDQDHATMRFLTKIETAMDPNVLDHPDSRLFTRSSTIPQ